MKEENIKLIFGLKVKQLRADLGLSLSEVSKKAGISVSYLNEIEKGKKYPKTDKVSALAEALDADYDWLVSLQLSQKMAPITHLIQSELLTSLPFELFGIDLSELFSIISSTPTKVSAFISTIIEVARNYDMTIERFYYSVLRSYQEMHDNYFDDLEGKAAAFVKRFELPMPIEKTRMGEILEEEFGYQLDHDELSKHPELFSLRTAIVRNGGMRLMINQKLTEKQKAFAYCKELGYSHLKLSPRSYTSSWTKEDSFYPLLNNFRASYFAGAILLPLESILKDTEQFLHAPKFEPEYLLGLLDKYRVSPETLFQRLTNILPKYFDLPQLFFARFHHDKFKDESILNKELHLAGLYNPHGTMLDEHYCRRWISISVFDELKKLDHQDWEDKPIICRAQRVKYIGTDNEYLCLTLAYPSPINERAFTSVTLGFLVNNSLPQKIKFANERVIPRSDVSVACEKCPAEDCDLRAAPPTIYREKQRVNQMLKKLETLGVRQ